MGKKEESGDRETHYIIQPGPDTLSPGCRELTQAVRIQQRSLEQRVQNCLDELRRLCVREAELTGVLPREYPLKQGETPPKVRRRVGAAFSLDERTILPRGEDPLSYLERDLALQLQITEAARRLYREDSLAKPVRRQRKAALRAAERKLTGLEERLSQERSQGRGVRGDDSSVSESSSLSDITILEEDDTQRLTHATPSSVIRPLPPQTLEGLCPLWCESDPEKSPLQNSPWMESSLDLPYEKPRRGACDSESNSSSPTATPIPSPQEAPVGGGRLNCTSANIVTLSMHSTPETSSKRGISPSMRVQSAQDLSELRGRSSCRRATSFAVPFSPIYNLTNPIYNLTNPIYNLTNPIYNLTNPIYFSSDNHSDSSSPPPSYKLTFCPVAPQEEGLSMTRAPSLKEHAGRGGPSRSEVTEELQWWHVRARMRGGDVLRPRSLDRQGAIRLRSGASQSQLFRSKTQRVPLPPRQVLRRTAEGTPLQWYDPDEAQIISQV